MPVAESTPEKISRLPRKPRDDGSRRARVVVLLALWIASGLYAWHYLDQGWYPHDAGTLGQSAERVLQGEMPHRDFDDVYTGGLSYLNALAFRIFGTKLMSLRLFLFGAFLTWIPAVYYVASRFAPPPIAVLVSLLAIAWSVPNYPEAMPSWYNLFLAVFCVAGLLRFVETGHRRWLFAGGAAAGLSVLVKIVGLYSVVGGVLALAYLEQTRPKRAGGDRESSRLYSVLLAVGAALFTSMLVLLVRHFAGVEQFVHFVLPGAALSAFLVWEEWRRPRGLTGERVRRLLFLVGPFLTGAVLPVLLFLIPYLFSGSLTDLVHGLFAAPAGRFQYALHRPIPFVNAMFSLPLIIILARTCRWSRPVRVRILCSLSILLSLLFFLGQDRFVYRMVLLSLRTLMPLIVLAGLALLAKEDGSGLRESGRKGQQVMILLCGAAMFSLIQFPYATTIYFMYVMPLVALTALAAVSLRPVATATFALFVVFYLVFVIRWVTPGPIIGMGYASPRPGEQSVLALERGGVLVSAVDKATYEEVVRLLKEHAGGEYIYATPDCPEVYYLSGLRNPTRTFFDFFDVEEGRTERILAVLSEKDVRAVVVNKKPHHSGPVPIDLRNALIERYPNSAIVGKFVLRWAP